MSTRSAYLSKLMGIGLITAEIHAKLIVDLKGLSNQPKAACYLVHLLNRLFIDGIEQDNWFL